MGELGLLGPEARVELIDGEVLEMSPQLSYHATGVSLASQVLAAAFGAAYHVRVQLPIRPLPHDEPEPDVSIVRGRIRDYTHSHPEHAALLLEVSDSTLRFDLRKKASLYASIGIDDYWVTDIPHYRVHVHRDPAPDSRSAHGYRYMTIRSYGPGESITPLAAPGASIAVNDLLPIFPEEETQ
jgi:Uma2 family endonuclease